ncbi:hypothetical protein WN943_026542 [Citrus x changshan-huyou]
MKTLVEEFSGSMKNPLQFDRGSVSTYSNRNHVDKFKLKQSREPIDPPLPPSASLQNNQNPPSDSDSSSTMSSYGDPADICELSNTTLKFISEILMEEDLEGKTCMLQDCLALQAAEKSFYDVLGQKYPPSPNQISPCSSRNSETLNDYCTSGSTSVNNLFERNWMSNQGDSSSSITQTNLFNSPESVLVPNLFSTGSSFLLNDNTAIINSTSDSAKSPEGEDRTYSSPYGSRGRKYDELEDSDYLEEGRSNKQSALSPPENEPLEMYDEVVLCKCENNKSTVCLIHGYVQNGSSGKLQQNGQPKGSSSATTRSRRKGKKSEVVDLWTLLTLCAQAVANYDQRTANDFLKQIRQHSSPFGDGIQRLAHYFANGLEVRLAGTRTPVQTHLASSRASAAEVLQAYKVYVSSCPFNRMTFFMANRMILKLAEKATRLHIVDFGIGYGFQWPCLIQRISKRPGGPPKIRMTAIEFPQPGFKPAERVEETGHRLKCYSQRFGVPFEYNTIAQKWQNIQLEDLKIDREEMTVVICLYRMRNLPDDTVVINSPRDAVLELIKKINPDIFIHGVVNGTYNAPFFLPRFREALFHFSTFFDMFESTVPREDQGRMIFEREIYGKDAMNVIACEGIERVERPETYKQWQARNLRAGFKQLELDKDILKTIRTLVKSNFHPDFVIDEAGEWMLQGWKGRLAYALSFWKPVKD